MIYKYIKPSSILQDFVRDYLVAHFIFDKNEPVPFKPYAPKPEQGITFFPKGFVSIQDQYTGSIIQAPKVAIFGQQVSRYNFHLTQEYLMLRVHFHPGALYRLLGTPLFEFTDQYSDAAAVVNREVEDVNESLAASNDYAQMIQIIEKYLLSKIKKINKDSYLIDKVAALMYAEPSKISLDYLANQACLSPRQFNRKFTERIGVGPKLYSRIIRFYRAYQYKEMHPGTDWLTIAVLFDYSDYQHLVKDFKEFAGVTPAIWVNEDNQSPERILNLE
jgi:AraC-like DNA-binding protein